jgi:hypothetical protein
MSRWGAGFAVAAVLLGPGEARADAPPADTQPAEPAASAEQPEAEKEHKGVLHHLLLYLPNRVFDVFDPVRARLRVGPGLAAQARVTEVAALALGAYGAVWAGLPGPRGKPKIPLPLGLESMAGAQASVAEAGHQPYYGVTEVGLGAQAVLVGLDLGVDPLEILDLAAGFVFIDLTGDDF